MVNWFGSSHNLTVICSNYWARNNILKSSAPNYNNSNEGLTAVQTASATAKYVLCRTLFFFYIANCCENMSTYNLHINAQNVFYVKYNCHLQLLLWRYKVYI